MPLRFISDTPATQSLVQAGLQRLAQRGVAAPQPMRGLNLQSAQLKTPHPVYDLRADAVASGGGLETAQNSGLRYIVTSPTGSLAAEVRADGDAVSSINSGPFVDATTQALNALQSMAAVAAGSYEARLLRCSALATLAIWLKSDRDSNDLIYPLSPAPPFLPAGVTYTPAEFLTALRPHARAIAAAKPGLTQG